jgi:hypothetical protein
VTTKITTPCLEENKLGNVCSVMDNFPVFHDYLHKVNNAARLKRINFRNKLLNLVELVENMNLNLMEAHTFPIFPFKPYSDQYVHELFMLVKRGELKAVEEILMEGYNTSSEFLQSCLHNYDHMRKIYWNPNFDKSIIDNRYLTF